MYTSFHLWQVYELLYAMRAEGVTTGESLRGSYHRTLWKRAKAELGI